MAANILRAFNVLQVNHNFDFTLRAEQVECINFLVEKKNVFCVLPTGYGKTLCFVLPPLILDQVSQLVCSLL